MADLQEMRQSIEATRALLRGQETALLEAEIADLEPQHRDLMTRCRTAKDEYEGLLSETSEMANEVRRCENAVKNAQWMIDQHRRDKLPAYPTEKEVEERRSTLARAQRECEDAAAKGGEVWGCYERLKLKRGDGEKAFNQLRDEEGMLAARLNAKRGELWQLKPESRPAPIDTSQFENLTYEYSSGGVVARPDIASRQYVGNATPHSTSVAQTMRRYERQADPLRLI